MKRYLKELGLKPDAIFAPTTTSKPRRKKDKKLYTSQRAKRGFDDRECWDLDDTFAIWLYEHIRAYEDSASSIVNLDYHKFNIPVLNEETGEEVIAPDISQRAALVIIKGYIKDYFVEPTNYGIEDWQEIAKFEEIQQKKLKIAVKIWAEILPAMWW